MLGYKSSLSQIHKMRSNLEASQNAPLKSTLNEQNNFNILPLNRNGDT